ncbi:MAG: hypothetical protein KDB03_24710 [Planctomycetales bacterium]|nr:hypothetical protein [Planctomycetales bacterium]
MNVRLTLEAWGRNLVPGEWFKSPSPTDNPPASVFGNWGEPQTNHCPDLITRYWEDRPTILAAAGTSVDIKFAVRILAGETCRCDGNDSKELQFSLHARISKIDALFPEKVEFAPNPPVLTPGLSGEPIACNAGNIPASKK